VHTAVEEFGRELAAVIQQFLMLAAWAQTERIVVGGGLISSHIGELAMGRAAVLLGEKSALQFCSIGNHPDEAGLLGVVQLAPSWVLAGHDAVLAVDIGGTNIRVGLVKFKLKKDEVTKAEVVKLIHWRYVDERPSRNQAVDRLAHMLKDLVGSGAAAELKLAPFVGVACPGLIDEHGTIVRGGQNLPGNWEGEDFNLPREIATRLERLHGHEPVVVMHNDAVVQGLSEVPSMHDVSHWGVLTIGTGLGNAHFTNRHLEKDA
jgi:ROK family